MSENEKIMKLLEEIRDRLPAPAMRPVPLQQPWYPYPNYPVYPWYTTPWWGTITGGLPYGTSATSTITGNGATTYAVNV